MKQLLLRTKLYGLTGKIAATFGVTCKKPIVVVGTGRCGSSLLYRIFDSHRDIVAYPGEANELWHPKSYPFVHAEINIPPFVVNAKLFTELSIKSWPHHHRQSIQEIFCGFHVIHGRSKFFLVKSAMIAFMIPEILSMFPDAKFIHIYRNGPSVVESHSKKEWGKYSTHMADEKEYRIYCAKYWNSCILEINRVNESLQLDQKGALFELRYEYLCKDPHEAFGDLGTYTGLDPEHFEFDISEIRSRNYKVGDYTRNKNWAELLEAMYPAMKLKGYLE